MFIKLVALPLLIQVAAIDGVPHWDVTKSCRGAANAAGEGQIGEDRFKSCLASEQNTRTKLQSDWAKFPHADKVKCIESIEWFEPTYTELAACLEMYRDARTGIAKEPVKPASKKR
jgi:hypothetical protein